MYISDTGLDGMSFEVDTQTELFSIRKNLLRKLIDMKKRYLFPASFFLGGLIAFIEEALRYYVF